METTMNGGGSPIEPKLAVVSDDGPNYDAVSDKDEKVAEAPELGKLGGEAIEKYTEAAAAHIEQVGKELLELAMHHDGECKRLAKEMREAAKLMAVQTVQFTRTIKQAGDEVTAIRARFEPQGRGGAN
jgi:transcription-repair coupling factor (superfamily II helicase)